MDTKFLGVTPFVKKIVSMNPTRYEFRSLDLALAQYHQYLFTVHDYKKQNSAKTFKQWLKTEI